MIPRLDPVAAGLLLGFVADRVLGDPRRGHPVAGFGRYAAWVERRCYLPDRLPYPRPDPLQDRQLDRLPDRRRTRFSGGYAVAAALAPPLALGVAVGRAPAPARVLLTAAATWAVLGGRSLAVEGHELQRLLDADDLPGARQRIRNLVGRDPSRLTAAELARACVESIAENSSDAVVAPLCWGAVAGPAGLLGYRAVNTLDAMWGHRSPRYREFGWAAATLDDVANWAPARLTVAVTAALAGRRGRQVIAVARRDGPQHPSPNAGPVEAGWAAALGVRLGGSNDYDGVIEDRGRLGDGPPVTPADILRATRHLGRVSWAALGVMLLGRAAVRRTLLKRRS